VSTQRGWLLEARGNGTAQRVLTTRDGGRSWSLVGAAPALADVESPATLRFADAQHGFLFERSQLYVTGDGGAHWSAAAPPGRPVQDLATWGGRVYVIAQRLDDPNGSFGIFSAPVAAPAAWIADPLHLALGAGPVPEVDRRQRPRRRRRRAPDGERWLAVVAAAVLRQGRGRAARGVDRE